jgi:transaldolase/glucose-6-phosphate isomerase
VPAGLIGIDLDHLLDRGRWMASQCEEEVPYGRNPGLVLGAVLGQAAVEGKDKVTFLSDAEYAPFETWLEQLLAESTGKEGYGIIPVAGEPPGNPEQYGKDRLFIYLKGGGENSRQADGLMDAGHPVLVFDIREPYELGAEFYRWEYATAIACMILGVNAFDQPDVQDSKSRTQQLMADYLRVGSLEEGSPVWENAEARIYSQDRSINRDGGSLSDLVKAFLAGVKSGEYVAVQAFLPHTRSNEAALHHLQNAIRKLTGSATTVGFGPRFLHSTGQLHKGGPDRGVFIQVTADPDGDLLIPGEQVSFGTLERAQALGDLEALQERNRRVIRIHLTGADLPDLI